MSHCIPMSTPRCILKSELENNDVEGTMVDSAGICVCRCICVHAFMFVCMCFVGELSHPLSDNTVLHSIQVSAPELPDWFSGF